MENKYKVLVFSALEISDNNDASKACHEILSEQPMWVAVNGFHDQNLELIDRIPKDQNILWRIEYMGDECIPFVNSSGHSDEEYIKLILDIDNNIVIYSFNEWNKKNILSRFPILDKYDFITQPIAQKDRLSNMSKPFREEYNIDRNDILIGVAGVYEPCKGIDEIGQWVSRLPKNRFTAFFSLITDDDTRGIRDFWLRHAGISGNEKIIVRKGFYQEWGWMGWFYDAVDVVLVNSKSDSWGRVVSEPIGLGTPVIVREANCGTSQILSDIVTVPNFKELTSQNFIEKLGEAKKISNELYLKSARFYNQKIVLRQWLKNLQKCTQSEDMKCFDNLVATNKLGDLNYMLTW